MIAFFGQDQCLVDSNGRIKLSPRVISDFMRKGPDVVLHCLPEGAIGVYSEDVFNAMENISGNVVQQAGESVVYRRTLRAFGAMSQMEKISTQGRITLSPLFRNFAGLVPGSAAIVVGVRIGVEIWLQERWELEQKKILEHMVQRGNMEMQADLEPVHHGETFFN